MSVKDTLTNLSTKMQYAAGRTSIVVQKNSPEILMGAGIVGMVVTVITACKATLKADEVLDHHAEKMRKIREAEEYQDEECPYPPALAVKEKTVAYVQTGGEFAKLYGPTVAIGSLSIACVLVSNRILNKRYLAAVAAYNTISMSYEQYRSRVRERYGEDVDYEMRYGVKREKIEQKYTDEHGKTTKKKEEIEVIEGQPSEYARVWEMYLRDGVLNPNWDENPEFNMLFLKGVETEANHKLHARGYLFLNEVYDMLGYDSTQVGQLVGWVDNGDDGFVDLGLSNLNNRNTRRFINGQENAVLLDFNVDGMIWDKI